MGELKQERAPDDQEDEGERVVDQAEKAKELAL